MFRFDGSPLDDIEGFVQAVQSARREAVQTRTCPFCDSTWAEDSFRDEASLTEAKISGLCQSCQDEVFGE